MALIDNDVSAKEVMKLIDRRIESTTREFYIARGKGDSEKSAFMAEVKYNLVELKMDFVDLLTGDL